MDTYAESVARRRKRFRALSPVLLERVEQYLLPQVDHEGYRGTIYAIDRCDVDLLAVLIERRQYNSYYEDRMPPWMVEWTRSYSNAMAPQRHGRRPK